MSFKDGDNPPTYEETVESYKHGAPTFASRIASVQYRKLDDQTRSIDKLMVTTVEPFIEHLAIRGIRKASLIAVPVDSRDLQHTDLPWHLEDLKKPHSGSHSSDSSAILGFPTGEYLRMIRLDSEKDTCSFWANPHIIEALQTRIRRMIGAGQSVTEPPRAAQSSLSCTKSSNAQSRRRSADSQSSSDKFSTRKAREASMPASVVIRMQEVSLRVPGPMDLWEIHNGDALVISILIQVDVQ